MAEALYMTVKQYAERVAASTETIYDMCRKGQLPAIKIGGWRINVARADKMLEEKIEERLAEFKPKVVPIARIRGQNASGDYLKQLAQMRKRVV